MAKEGMMCGKSKQHCCMFCKKFNTKMSTHLQRVPKDEPTVAQSLSLKKLAGKHLLNCKIREIFSTIGVFKSQNTKRREHWEWRLSIWHVHIAKACIRKKTIVKT